MEQKQRKSPRASWYDYTSPGWYFITICTKDRTHYFGEIQDGQMILNELWNICAQAIDQISTRKSVDIHEWIVMPNHVHIVLVMSWYPTNVGADHQSALHNTNYKGDLLNRPYNGPSLSSIVKLFKWHITKYAQQHGIVFGWQRSFHDHIIRNETEYERIKYYIQTNPQNRTNDTFYAL
jgi:putative transposase